MRPRAPLSFRFLVAPIAAASMVVAVGAFMVACSKQGEAERCSLDNGNDDCDSNLECVSRPGINSTICCPPIGQATTKECNGDVPAPVDSAVKETATDTAVETAVVVDGGIGATCTFESDCVAPFRCRSGKCNFECVRDRDCQLESPTRPFCDSCGDHQCHTTFLPEFIGTKDEAGTCVAPSSDAGETGTDAGDDAGDTTVEDSSTVDTATDDVSTADGG
ncbi:MAG: hypothetical protein ABI175_18525 [Polyangiales bacterium]